MDKATVKTMQDDMAKAVEDVAQKYGLRITKSAARFSDHEVSLTFGFRTTDTAAILTREKADWEKYAKMFGLEPDDFGQEFEWWAQKYCITGVNLGRTKYPIKACLKGTTKMYKFSADMVKFALKRF